MSFFKNIQSVIIVALIATIFLLRQCNPTQPSEDKIITKVEVKWDTIKKEVPKYVPKLVTKIEIDIDTFSTPIDTAAILKDYYSINYFEDYQEFDSLTLTIRDSISQNRIYTRSLEYKIAYPTKTITKEIYKNKREFFTGLGIAGNQEQIQYFGGELLYKNKKKQIFGVGIGINQNLAPTLSSRIYWKLGK
jgi:hypothetical protein